MRPIHKSLKAPKNLTKKEVELWNMAQEDMNAYCATFGAPTVIKLLKEVNRLRGSKVKRETTFVWKHPFDKQLGPR